MDFRYAISIVLEAHMPFVKDCNKENGEDLFFEAVSETYLPLLEVLGRLENDHVPFRLAIAMSPVMCHLLCDEQMQEKYLSYIDKQIEFGKHELERTANNAELHNLAEYYYTKIIDNRFAYTEKYEKNILKALDFYKRRGKLEILASCATHSFLPLIAHHAESIQAQMEIPVSYYRKTFGDHPHGFWLPGMGWTPEIDPFLKAYNFNYTIVSSHGLLFGTPTPEKGCFYPVKTQRSTFIFANDYYALNEMEEISLNAQYRNNNLDAGYELEPAFIKCFLSPEGERRRTGFKYYARKPDNIYNRKAALEKTKEAARFFLETAIARLEEASKHMKEPPLCVFANNACNFGRLWHEGMQFLEDLFRLSNYYRDFRFINPGEYLCRQDISSLQICNPEFSSGGKNGYCESWLDVSNDKLFRHLYRAMERMTELAERFPDETGLKEHALNQAAREILFAQSSDGLSAFSRNQMENSLRNFTTIYEALGSNYISTEWLTTLEKKHNIFPNINYRIFRRKK